MNDITDRNSQSNSNLSNWFEQLSFAATAPFLFIFILSANRHGGDSMAEKKMQKRAPGYKSENQKHRSLLVMQYILKNADDERACKSAWLQLRNG